MNFLEFKNKDDIENFCRSRMILHSLLETFCDDYFSLKINGENFDEIGTEFAARYNEKPETLFLILEENKKSILYSVADNEYKKPKDMSPEEYYDLLVKTFHLLYFYCGFFYGSDTKIEESCDSYLLAFAYRIITQSLNEMADDGFWNEYIKSFYKNVKTLRTLKKNIVKFLNEVLISDKEMVKVIVDDLFKVWEREWKHTENFTEETKLEYYCHQFYGLFSPSVIAFELEED